MGTIKTTNIEPIANNGTVTLGSSGDTFTVPSGVTVAGAMANTPSFYAKLSASQSISSGSWTKINLNAEEWDTDNAFDTSNYKFTVPSGEGGKYFIGYSLATDSVIDDNERLLGKLYLNTNPVTPSTTGDRGTGSNVDLFLNFSTLMDLSAGDYLELYAYQNEGASQNILANYTRMWGNKLIG
jgi:hypothetical protein